MPRESIGEFEQLVLLTILRLGSDAYGVPIFEELARHTSRPILRPSVYVALRRLEEKGRGVASLSREDASGPVTALEGAETGELYLLAACQRTADGVECCVESCGYGSLRIAGLSCDRVD